MSYYLEVLKEYTEFDGRVRRKKFWLFNLVNFIVALILVAIEPTLQFLYGLGIFLPSLGVTIRRLHDTNRSGWWILISFIPIVNIVLLVFLVQDSTPRENQYGSNPKEKLQNNQVSTKNGEQKSLGSKEQSSLESSKIECSQCGELISSESGFCSHCGSEVIPKGKQKCSNCEVIVQKGVKFCSECGFSFESEIANDEVAVEKESVS